MSRKTILSCISITLALIVCGLYLAIRSASPLAIDSAAHLYLSEYIRSDFLTSVMLGLSYLVSPYTVIFILGILYCFVPQKQVSYCVIFALAGSTLLNLIIKNIVQRPRPSTLHLMIEHGYSFPSGHAMAAMALLGIFVWLIFSLKTAEDNSIFSHTKQIMISSIFILLILAIGVSRIYLGVHYASDVIAGYSCSLLWLIGYTQLIVPKLFPELTSSK